MKIQLSVATLALLSVPAGANFWKGLRRNLQADEVPADATPDENADSADEISSRSCSPDGMSKYPFQGKDNSERLLLREGVIDAIPSTLCGHDTSKNVILVIGDGMGWEMYVSASQTCRILFLSCACPLSLSRACIVQFLFKQDPCRSCG